MRQHAARLQMAAQHVEERRLGGLLSFAEQVGVEQWTMERHKPCMATDRQMQRSNVAITDEWLGVIAQQLEIDTVKQAWRAVTTSQADDGVDFRIGKCRMQIVQPHLIATGQVAFLS